uniref:F-box domain-containing protein n=1 Tax=Panagrolaimus sp. JU765 TaxID=591449 RepID=A0AC34R7I8_9BILA
MDHFDLFSLPLEIQDMIVGEMVHNFPPDNWFRFVQTSKYSNWLVQRAKPKKIAKELFLHIESIGLIKYKISSGKINFGTSDQLMEIFKNIQVIDKLYLSHEFNFRDETIWTPNFEKEFLKMSEFVIKIYLVLPEQFNRRFLEFYQNLKNLQYLVICGNNMSISILPYIPSRIRFLSFEESESGVVDEFLICSKILAEKSKKFPLKGFNLDLDEACQLNDVKNFLQSATFFNNAGIIFFGEYCVDEVKKMIQSIGGREVPGRKRMFLKKNIQIVPRKADESVNGIHILLWEGRFLL